MSGSRPKPAERQLAEQHLGDRLSALVDGELGHETRERVLAHLATCARCKAEAEAQRALKSVFAAAAPPPPSESFLARLQGLPAGGDPDGGGSPFAGGDPSGHGSDSGVFGVSRDDRFEFGYVPARPHDPAAVAGRGFRIHPVGRPDTDRSASRSMRFAFVAAGAVSLAAVALGGVTAGLPGAPAADARSGTGGGSVAPAGTAGSGTTGAADTQRRRLLSPLLSSGALFGGAPAVPTSVSAPLLPGVPSPAAGQQMLRELTAPVMAGAAAVSPLIRPLSTNPPFALTSWTTAPEVTGPGLLAAPVPDATSAPSSPSPSRSSRAPR
ncbi:zf-HC2 domain-containing protein [Streptomyces fuscichromogenes]|uniref:Membrane protein n=1 Tax=Streptomyces fuscichromogenes TaxID=1324013 RepID=A0A917XKW8_9ACTN|nr:zf-HC2 domain-containing protein [Streptomyces fuscichromogenes]GGN35846.1 membrane protein [Streptomyces fuscichromogenes]